MGIDCNVFGAPGSLQKGAYQFYPRHSVCLTV